jgi:hypothetical protein
MHLAVTVSPASNALRVSVPKDDAQCEVVGQALCLPNSNRASGALALQLSERSRKLSIAWRNLLYGDQRSDWNLLEEFACDVAREADAPMRGGIIRDNAFVHSEIEATKAHKIRHLDFVDGGPMVAIFVCDNKGAGTGGITAAPGRTRRAEYGHAILYDFSMLRGQRDFDAELIGWWAAAEKDLGASPVLRFRSKIEGEHLTPTRFALPVRTSIEQGTKVFLLTQSGSEHKNGDAPIIFQVTAEHF